MFADHVIINKGKVSCTIHSVIWTDLSCIKQLYNTALIFNLITPTNNTREYFSRLINLQLDNTVLYVMVNATHLWLDNANSYIICRKLSVNSSDVSNFNVMRTKHFSSLSTLLMRWVDTLNKKYSSILDTFLLLSERETLQLPSNKLNLCKAIEQIDFKICSHEITFPSKRVFQFLEAQSTNIALADEQLSIIINFIKTNCDNSLYYYEVESLIEVLTKLKDRISISWELDSAILYLFHIPVINKKANWDIKKCIEESIHNKISESEAMLFSYFLHNAKTFAITEASLIIPNITRAKRISLTRFLEKPELDILPHPIHNREANEFNNPYPARNKRWIWTKSLSAISGLAQVEDLQKTSNNQESIRNAQLRDEQEIAKIEMAENSLLDELKSNNEQLSKLYKDEDLVNLNLIKVMDSEKSVIGKLERISEAMEFASDIQVEFNDIILSIKSVENRLNELLTIVNNILHGNLPTELLSQDLSKFVDDISIHFSKISIFSSVSSRKIFIEIPIYEKWNLFRFRNLPFGNPTNNIFYRLPDFHQLIATRNELSFLFEPSACLLVNKIHACNINELSIRRKPISCIETLLKNSPENIIPPQCEAVMKLVSEIKQEFISKENKSIIFSPYDDYAMRKLENGTFINSCELSKGITIISNEFDIFTKELFIPSSLMSHNASIESEFSITDLSMDFLALTEQLSVIPKINDSKLIRDMNDFISAEGIHGADLKKTEKQLEHIQSLSRLANYSISQFSLNKFEGIDSGISWLILFVFVLVIFIPILICCGTCKCCRHGFVSACKGLWYIITLLFTLIYHLCRTGKKRAEIQEPLSHDLDSRTDETTGEDSTSMTLLEEYIHWFVVKVSNERLIICGTRGKFHFTYIPNSDFIKDSEGHEIYDNIPNSKFMNEYQKTLEKMPVPKFTPKDDKLVLDNFPEIYFDKDKKNYRNITTGNQEFGFRCPLFFDQ